MEQEKRIYYWDNLKFGLITLVILGHYMKMPSIVIETLVELIYLFHMPLFIFVSGVFHRNTNVKERMAGLLMTGLVYQMFLYFLDMLSGNVENKFSLFNTTKIPWFVICLALCCGLTYIVRDYDFWVVIFIAVGSAVFLGYDTELMEYVSVARTIAYFPFYYCGSKINKEKVPKLLKYKKVRSGGGIIFFIIGISFIVSKVPAFKQNIFIFYMNCLFGNVQIDGWKYIITRLGNYMIIGMASFGFMCCVPERKIKIVSAIGCRTLQIYFWHIPMRQAVFYPFIYEALGNSVIGAAIYTILTLISCYLLALPWFSFPTKQIMGAPYKKRGGI